jgi:hypothetical protein
MAAVTLGVTTPSTSNTNSYTSGSFTPAASDLLVAFVIATDTVGVGTLTDTQTLGWTEITRALRGGSADTAYLFVANALAANSSMTVTFDCTGDNATGCIITVLRVSGMSRVGASAVLQFNEIENQAGGGTPTITLASAVLTENPVVAMVANGANPAAVTEPSGFTERSDNGYATPGTGMETASVDSGFTSDTVIWSSTSSGNTCAIAAELDTSAAGATGQPTARRWGGVPHMGGRKGFNGSSGGGTWGRHRSGIWVPSRVKEAA